MTLASPVPRFTAVAPLEEVLRELLAVSLTGVILYTPLYDPAGSDEIIDFTFAYLNPTAQRMMGMPEVPSVTHHEQWPHSRAHGTFAFHVEAFESGESRAYNINYQADGYDNYYRLAARRVGQGLLVSFTDTADQPRSRVEVALRQAQEAEQAARAEAEVQRQRFYDVLMQLPAHVAVHEGPDQVFTLVNPGYQRIANGRDLLGQPIRAVWPELAEHGILDVLERVYQTGEPYTASALPVQADFTRTGQLEQVYYDFFFLALRSVQGQITGVLNFSYDVTAQVLARQQVEQLNQELEARVQQRTHEAEAARAEADEQRHRLVRLFSQAPAHINLFQGPDHVWTLVHPRTQQLLPDRTLLGVPRRQALPELPELQHEPFDRVYRTGQPIYLSEASRRLARDEQGELFEEFFDITFQPKFDAAGQVAGVMSFAVNVTDRVHARQQTEALQAQMLAAAQREAQTRQALYQVFEQTSALVALLRAPAHRYEYVNAAYQAFFPGRPLVGLDVAVAAPELVAQGFGAHLDTVYQTGDTFFGTELPFTPPPAPGQPACPAYFNFTYQAYREGGEIAGVSVFATDVTEQVLARAQREAERQQLHHLFMEAPAPIVILDGLDLVYQLVNPAYQRIFPGRELLGRPLLAALPELHDSPIPALLRGVYETGETYVAQELPLLLAQHDGGPLEELSFTFTYQARRSPQGAVDGIMVFAHEVTDQVQARRVVEESGQQAQAMSQELAHSNQQLTRTNVDLDNFIYTASHDLKAPIANIEGLLYLLQEELPPTLTQAG